MPKLLVHVHYKTKYLFSIYLNSCELRKMLVVEVGEGYALFDMTCNTEKNTSI